MNQITLRLLSAVFAITVLLPSCALADNTDIFHDKVEISDGKNGRLWNQWSRAVGSETVLRVFATVKKVSGGNDTFINLRWGNGSAFENGKQVFLQNNKPFTAQWSVNQRANGRPLVLNAYNGVVAIISVKVVYSDDLSSGNTPGQVIDARRSQTIGNRHRTDDYQGRPAHRPRNSHPNTGISVGSNRPRTNDQQQLRLCQRGNYSTPNLEIHRSKTSGRLFSGKYRIKGSIAGSCIEEAGYYENGSLKQSFQIPYSARFQRQEFEVQVRSGRQGEFRVYTTNGASNSIDIDSYISQNKNNNQNTGNNTGWSWP